MEELTYLLNGRHDWAPQYRVVSWQWIQSGPSFVSQPSQVDPKPLFQASIFSITNLAWRWYAPTLLLGVSLSQHQFGLSPVRKNWRVPVRSLQQ